MPDVAYQIAGMLPLGGHGGRVTEDYAHDEIHDGNYWRVGKYVTLAAASVLSIMITTPAAGEIHLIQGVGSDGPGIARFWEAPNATGGTVLTANNALRSYAGTANSTIFLEED